MTDYTKTVNFTAKDSLSIGDPAKLILGALFDVEFDAIAVAIASKFDVLDVATSAEAEAGASNSKLVSPLTLEYWSAQNAGMVQDLSNLADPNADRITFWDDSAGALALLTVSTGLTISGTNFTTNDSQIVLTALSGYVANEHINHTSVTMTAGTGLTGGGTIAATRTFNLDISGLTALAVEPDPTDGFLVDDAGVMKRTAWSVIKAVFATAAQGTLASNSVQKDGSVALTSNWDVGSFEVRALKFYADVTTGTAPFTIASTTVSTNLNADMVDGFHASSFLQNVVEDTTPQLGGSLDVNGQKIVSVSNGNIDIEPHGTGNVFLGNFSFNADQTVGAGQDNYVLTYDNATGLINLEVAPGAGSNAVGTDIIWDAAGDLVYGTGADAAARLAIGAAGSGLVVNAGGTAPEWSASAVLLSGGALGTPSGGILSSCTGLPVSTGISGLGTNVAAFLATPNSANLAAALTDEVGTAGTVPFYSTGSFTPVIWDDSLSSSESQTYTSQVGSYVRIGNLLFVFGNIIINSLGTLTTSQETKIGGLPSTSSGGSHAVYVGYADSLGLGAANMISGIIDNATSHIRMMKHSATTGATPLTIAELSANGQILFSGCYRV